MKKVLLFGASGNLGRRIAAELAARGYQTTAVVRNQSKADMLKTSVNDCLIANVTKPDELENICDGFDVVISSLGKSVSPNDRSKATFHDVDFKANNYILREAIGADVKKFVYVSALGAEKYPRLAYFKAHRDFSEKLVNSDLNFSIIKPPALFSAFLDLIEMARKGRLMTIGKGDKRTNPIYEGDLARVCVDAIGESNKVIEAGGKEILTRREINEIIQRAVAPGKKIRRVPVRLFRAGLPLIRLFDRNAFDKFAFFAEVTQHDTLAPPVGETRLEEYLKTILDLGFGISDLKRFQARPGLEIEGAKRQGRKSQPEKVRTSVRSNSFWARLYFREQGLDF